MGRVWAQGMGLFVRLGPKLMLVREGGGKVPVVHSFEGSLQRVSGKSDGL